MVPNLTKRFHDKNDFLLKLICSTFSREFIYYREILAWELQWKYVCFPSYELIENQVSINIKETLTHRGLLWSYLDITGSSSSAMKDNILLVMFIFTCLN